MIFTDDIRVATEFLFNERQSFIILGLTGRTGSGCSTVSQLLGKTYEELAPIKPLRNNFVSNDERKYQIVYDYATVNWTKFEVIPLISIITSFLLEYDYNHLISFLSQTLDNSIDLDFQAILEDSIKVIFDDLHVKRIEVKNKLSRSEDALKDEEVYQFFFELLPQFSNKLKEVLNIYQKNYHTLVYQKIGNNIRTSGEAYGTDFNPKNIFKLSERTNTLIKILRKRNLITKGKVLIVIDAIRNPYEATFFKDRYSAFYLFSVNTENKTRKQRLFNEKKLSIDEIERMDEQEYPEKQKGVEKFISQNIQKCLEISDVHIYNPTIGNKDYTLLTQQLIRYVSLIMHPGLITPTHLERCMQIAFNAKYNSGCLSRQVGAVVTDSENHIKAVGWNCTPTGQVPCNLRKYDALINKDDKQAFSHYELNNQKFCKIIESIKPKINKKVLKGRQFTYCFKDAINALQGEKNQVHTRALHAEENAFLQIAKLGGVGLQGGILFTTASPCELCSKKAYQIGIKTVYYIDQYPGISEDHIFRCGNNQPEIKLFHGAVGRAYNQFYTPIIPYKDELNMILGIEYIKPLSEKN